MINLVTSFSADGYKRYGKDFLDSLYDHIDEDEVTPWVFYEGEKPKMWGPHYVPLDADLDRTMFLKRHAANYSAMTGIHETERGLVYDYRFQAVRFSHKVFAMTYVNRPDDGPWVWCDADVEVTGDLDAAFWKAAADPEMICSYLGRTDWDHSETGWLAFGDNASAEMFLRQLRRVYTSDEIFTLPGWTDSFAFDHVRENYKPLKGRKRLFANLSEGVPGNDVWPQTVLGTVMRHNKGFEKFGKEQ